MAAYASNQMQYRSAAKCVVLKKQDRTLNSESACHPGRTSEPKVNEPPAICRKTGTVHATGTGQSRADIALLECLKKGNGNVADCPRKCSPAALWGLLQADCMDIGRRTTCPSRYKYKVSNPYENLTSSGLSCPPCLMRPDICSGTLTGFQRNRGTWSQPPRRRLLVCDQGDSIIVICNFPATIINDLLWREK